MKSEQNALYFFTKSGSQVRAIAPADRYVGQPRWTAERVSGASKGKQVIVPALALVTTLD